MAGSNNKLIADFASASLIAERLLAPWCCWRAGHFMFAAIAAAVRVVSSGHYDTTHSRADSHVTFAAGAANLDVLMLLIANRSDRSHAFNADHTDLTARQLDLGPFVLFGYQLGADAGSASQLCAFAGLHFNGMDDRTVRYAFNRQPVTSRDRCLLLNNQFFTRLHAFGG